MAHNHFNLVRVRPVYFGPARYYASRVDVGICRMSTRKTRKIVPSLSVGLLNVTANTALPRSVTGIDEANLNAYTSSFISDLRLKIGKSPRVKDASLWPASPDPISDAFEVFEGNTETGAFGCNDNLLGNLMIDVCGKIPFFATSFLEESFGALSPFGLELLTQSMGAKPEILEVCSGVVPAVGSRCYVDDPDVYAKPTEDLVLFGVRDINRNEKVELSFTKNKIRFATLELEKLTLMISTDEWHAKPATYGPNASGVSKPSEDTSVVGDSSERLKRPLCDLINLVTIRHFSNTAANNLRGEVLKRGSTFMVTEFMDRKLTKGLRCPSPLRDPVTGFIGTAKRQGQRSRLSNRRFELNLNRKLHNNESAIFHA